MVVEEEAGERLREPAQQQQPVLAPPEFLASSFQSHRAPTTISYSLELQAALWQQLQQLFVSHAPFPPAPSPFVLLYRLWTLLSVTVLPQQPQPSTPTGLKQ